jgi:hypothetical protein
VWFNPAFWGYNEKMIEMARAHSADEGCQIAKYCPFRPTVLDKTESMSSVVGVGGCLKERFKGNGNFLGGFKEGDFEICY